MTLGRHLLHPRYIRVNCELRLAYDLDLADGTIVHTHDGLFEALGPE